MSPFINIGGTYLLCPIGINAPDCFKIKEYHAYATFGCRPNLYVVRNCNVRRMHCLIFTMPCYAKRAYAIVVCLSVSHTLVLCRNG